MTFRKINIGTGEEEFDIPRPNSQPKHPKYDYPTPQPQIVPHTPDVKAPNIPPSMLPVEIPKKPKKPKKEWINKTRVSMKDCLNK